MMCFLIMERLHLSLGLLDQTLHITQTGTRAQCLGQIRIIQRSPQEICLAILMLQMLQIHILYQPIVIILLHGQKDLTVSQRLKSHSGQGGGAKIIIHFYLVVITQEKIQIAGRKCLVVLCQIWMYIWSLMIAGLIGGMLLIQTMNIKLLVILLVLELCQRLTHMVFPMLKILCLSL